MAIKLPDAVVACIVGCLGPADWGRLMSVDRDMQQQLLRVLATTPAGLSVDCSIRSWKSLLQAVGSWCGCITHLSLLQGSARIMSSLQLLQPHLQPTLTHLTLQGFKLDHEPCHGMQLIDMLLRRCPKLESLDLQDCDLPHLGIFKRLTAAQTAPRSGHAHCAATERSGLIALQLTGARLAAGPSTHSNGSTLGVASGAAGKQLLSPAHCGSPGAGHGRGCADIPGLQEMHLGCHCSHVDTAWLHLNSAVTSSHVIDLLQDGMQALRVLDVSKRPAVGDKLLLHLAAQPPAYLHTLDVSLTRVTPEGLVQLLQHCPRLCNLKYACRAGDEGLSTQSMQRLAAVLLAVQELDLSLHPQLDASCLAALAQCKTLRKVKFARSHKITRESLGGLVASLPVLRELVVVRCRGIRQTCLAALAGRDSGLIVHT